MIHIRHSLIALLIALPMACAHQPETAHKPLATDEKPPAAAEDIMHIPSTLTEEHAVAAATFTERIIAASGQVSFVFEDDRPFAQCHASTITQTPDGGIVAAWFAGTKEKHSDVGIWMSKQLAGTWSVPHLAAKVEESAHWNPVLFTDANGTTYLFFKVGPEISHWRTWWMQSEDSGVTWTTPCELVAGDAGGRGPVKNKPIILSDGSWLAPASTEFDLWEAFADKTTDAGKTWQRSQDFVIDRKKLRGKGAIQPTLWESDPGHVHALLRTAAGNVWRTDSLDYGATWSPVYATGLPNNNSGLDVLRLDDGRLLLVLNPVGVNWGPRTPVSLALSCNNGDTWDIIAHLEDDPIETKHEYSYPAIIRTHDGIAISYTWRRERVCCWLIPDTVLNTMKCAD